MGEMKGFVMSLVCASAASALIDGFVPDGSVKKYVRYLISLCILLILLTPLAKIIGKLPSVKADADISYDSVEAIARANSLVAMYIENSVAEKFSLGAGEVDAVYKDGRISVSVKRHIGIFESDIILFILNNYGVEAEVEFYE